MHGTHSNCALPADMICRRSISCNSPIDRGPGMQLALGGLDMQGSIPTGRHRNPASLAAGDRIGLVRELGPGRWLIPGFNPRRNALLYFVAPLAFRGSYAGTLSDPDGVLPARIAFFGRPREIHLNLPAAVAAFIAIAIIVEIDRWPSS